jgi:hypothetical protein
LGLLVVLGLLGSLLVHGSLGDSEKTATRQAIKGCETPAHFLTNALKRQLGQRMELLDKVVGMPEFRPLIPTRRSDEPLANDDDARDKLKDWLNEFLKEQKNDQRNFFSNLIVTDARGWIIADSAGHTDLYQTRWDYRDWFNGKGDQPERKGGTGKALKPVSHMHFSQPFMSTHTEEGQHPLLVCISVPIIQRSKDQDEVIGLLVGAVNVQDLFKWIEQDDEMATGKVFDRITFPVIVDQRGYYLYYRDEATGRTLLPNTPDAAGPKLEESALLDKLLDESRSGEVDDYTDPVDHTKYLVYYRSIRLTKWQSWNIMIQHQLDYTLRPVQKMERWALWFGVISLTASFALVLGLWLWLLSLLRRERTGVNG